MQSEIKTITYPDGRIQRYQVVRWVSWCQLDFLRPEPWIQMSEVDDWFDETDEDDKTDWDLVSAHETLESFERIYRKFLIPGCPWIFGNVILFCLPEDMRERGAKHVSHYGLMADPLTAAAAVLRHGVKIIGGTPVFSDNEAETLYRELEERQCLRVACGKFPTTSIIPVRENVGLLSAVEPGAAMKVNASFFIMDPFDCATVYDQVGTAFGLCVKDGVVEQPPMYDREALMVRADGSVQVEVPDLRSLEIEINNVRYSLGDEVILYTRPERKKTPADDRMKVVIVGCHVAAVKESGSVPVPASGFVLSFKKHVRIRPGELVIYHGMEDVQFGIQVGNSILREGVKTETFYSPFYNIRKLERTPFPPSLYPMNYSGDRAARIALGADADGKPMLVWAEGAPKVGYVVGQHSCGASLTEMGEICSQAGMYQAINLDGGGSAQVLLSEHRFLQISDRKEDGTEAERPVPLGLIVRL